jgi:hypothetical protein
MSPRVELARRVLETLAHGHRVSTFDAFQLRNWALRPEDSMLTLAEIAISILAYGEGSSSDAAQARRLCAEFIMTDIELGFTLMEVARTSRIAEVASHNQKNARMAYDAILLFLPRSLPAFSATELEDTESKLAELKSRLQQLGETF